MADQEHPADKEHPAETAPVVYILHGEDEFQIAQTLAEMEQRLGDPATVAMNTTRLDGNTFRLDELLSVAGAMPFLAKRRLVILNHPLAKVSGKLAQDKFIRQIEQIPATTALILVEPRMLTPDSDRRKGKIHWLETWAVGLPKHVLIKAFPLPKGAEWNKRLQEMARKAGGQIAPDAAEMLYSLLDGDLRLANQEVEKLLAYVNYSRPVEMDDVEAVTADVGQGDIFAMVDALGSKDGRKAMSVLRRLLEYQDYFAIFGMVVRQFRLLVQTREILDQGGGRNEVVTGLKLGGRAFIADRMIPQARRFSMADLKRIYHQLLQVDQAVKTSQMEGELALETLAAALTTGVETNSGLR